MGDEIQNPRRIDSLGDSRGGCIVALGYIGGTAALLVALPVEAVGGPDGFVNGIQILSARLGLDWLLVPIALLVGLNMVGSAAGKSLVHLTIAVCCRNRSLSSSGIREDSPALSHAVGSDRCRMDWQASWWPRLGRREQPCAAPTTCW